MVFRPEKVFIDRSVKDHPRTRAILDKIGSDDIVVIDDIREIKVPEEFDIGKKRLFVTYQKGKAVKPCQGMTGKELCCNYWTMDVISNCPMECSYCVLQYYLRNNPILTLYVNVDEMAMEALNLFVRNKGRRFRVGTGELSDSIALDDITGFSERLIHYFSGCKNVILELKTKSKNVSHLFGVREKENTVIAWSLNSREVIEREEIGTATLEERISAAKEAVSAGFRVGFHFDPVIFGDGWEDKYREAVEMMLEEVPHNSIAWISIGTLRFPVGLKEVAMKRFPLSKIFFGELVAVGGKFRYFRPIRSEIYRTMLRFLSPLKGKVPIYLCMETRAIWEEVFPQVTPTNSAIETHVLSTL